MAAPKGESDMQFELIRYCPLCGYPSDGTAAFVAANLGVPRQAMLVTARHLWRKVETTHAPALAFDWAALEECYRDW